MNSDGAAWQPRVSVVVPMLNEIDFIGACLEGFIKQTYPHELLDVIVIDGGSDDGSRELVADLAREHPWIRVVDNPARRASSAFNRGVESAYGEVVCLFSAHGVPDREYIRASVEVLDETDAVGVGGQYLHEGLDPVSSAVGAAMVSPFGMASPHRFASTQAEVDTISHPAYRRDALIACGPFDETLERNSDYELNHRLRRNGGVLVFDPRVISIYRPRPSLRALGRQFWWYGRWKVRVIERHPDSLRARHLVPPVAVAVSAAVPALLFSSRGRRAVVAAGILYGAVITAAVVHSRPKDRGANPAVLAAALPVMHGAWGAGFLTSVIEDKVIRR